MQYMFSIYFVSESIKIFPQCFTVSNQSSVSVEFRSQKEAQNFFTATVLTTSRVSCYDIKNSLFMVSFYGMPYTFGQRQSYTGPGLCWYLLLSREEKDFDIVSRLSPACCRGQKRSKRFVRTSTLCESLKYAFTCQVMQIVGVAPSSMNPS